MTSIHSLIILVYVIGTGLCIPIEDDIFQVDSSHPLQIISPKGNHSFDLNLGELRGILNNDQIKDRDVVVVSVVGAFRQGKSFLLNFFLRYLNAQVIKVLLIFIRITS